MSVYNKIYDLVKFFLEDILRREMIFGKLFQKNYPEIKFTKRNFFNFCYIFSCYFNLDNILVQDFPFENSFTFINKFSFLDVTYGMNEIYVKDINILFNLIIKSFIKGYFNLRKEKRAPNIVIKNKEEKGIITVLNTSNSSLITLSGNSSENFFCLLFILYFTKSKFKLEGKFFYFDFQS